MRKISYAVAFVLAAASGRFAFAVLTVLAGASVAPPAFAMEGSQSPYLKGYRDFASGVLPPPGVQFRQDINVYSGGENSRIPQGQLTTSVRNVSSILGITVTTPVRVWGGSYGFAIRAAATDTSADRTVTNRFGGVTSSSASLTGFNDLVISPLVLGWHHGNWHWNVSATVWMPSGNYESTRLVNTGRNYWSWSPQFAVTYLDREAGLELSVATAYVVSYENTATRYQSGDMGHIDMAAMKVIAPRLWVGAVGYAMSQVTGDSGAGNTLGERKAEVFGAGPAVRYIMNVGNRPVALTAKYYREFSARNTTEGDTGAISLRFHF